MGCEGRGCTPFVRSPFLSLCSRSLSLSLSLSLSVLCLSHSRHVRDGEAHARNTSKELIHFCLKNGSSKSQNLALTVLYVPDSLDIGEERLRGGLVFKTHGLLYHSTLPSRSIEQKKKRRTRGDGDRAIHIDKSVRKRVPCARWGGARLRRQAPSPESAPV